jgi:hypothetical protein
MPVPLIGFTVPLDSRLGAHVFFHMTLSSFTPHRPLAAV